MSSKNNNSSTPRGVGVVRRIFVRGLAALLPTILTIAIVVLAYQFVNKYIANPINIVVTWILERAFHMEQATIEDIYHPLIGFLLAVLMVYVLGYLVATYLGIRVMRRADRILARFPVLGLVYPHVRQIVEFLFTKRSMHATQVVALEYPRKGVYSIGFVTSEALKDVQAKTSSKLVSVFVPSSPTPISGYVVMVPAEELIFLHVRVDEILRFLVSGGVLVPPAQQVTANTKGKMAALPEEGADGSETEDRGKSFDRKTDNN